MKKIINAPENIVPEMLRGLALANPDIEWIEKYQIIKRRVLNPLKVSLISGGGSGHEPAHAGYVGQGMLDAAVCGDVFASPSQVQVYQAIKAVAGQRGVLLVIKNYSGDVMNFKNAAALAEEEGIQVDYVKVDDDVAVKDSLYTIGRRGVAGTVFVHKIAGAAAERGDDLAAVKAAAEKAIANVRSIGFALSSCTVPAKGTPTFQLAESEMEYGVGIHGEPGVQREDVQRCDELASRMVDTLARELQLEKNNDPEVSVLINGFGSTPLMELYILHNAVQKALHQRGVAVYRAFVGNYMTSIDMEGASVSLLKMDVLLKGLLSEKSEAAAFRVDGEIPSVPYIRLGKNMRDRQVSQSFHLASPAIQNELLTLENIIFLVQKLSDDIIANEQTFCELDSHAGDGDFGMSVAKGFRQLKKEWDAILSAKQIDIGSFLDACALIIMEYCGGASGPIWGSAFRCAGRVAQGKDSITIDTFARMMQEAVAGIQKTGERSFGRGAVVGDKTLIDALVPCADVWSASAQSKDTFRSTFAKAARAAVDGAEQTRKIVARMGRAGTVGERSIGYPDAGAYALGVLFTNIAEAVR